MGMDPAVFPQLPQTVAVPVIQLGSWLLSTAKIVPVAGKHPYPAWGAPGAL